MYCEGVIGWASKPVRLTVFTATELERLGWKRSPGDSTVVRQVEAIVLEMRTLLSQDEW